MNEPANFGTGSVTGCAINKWNNPPYLPSKKAEKICSDLREVLILFIGLINEYLFN